MCLLQFSNTQKNILCQKIRRRDLQAVSNILNDEIDFRIVKLSTIMTNYRQNTNRTQLNKVASGAVVTTAAIL